MPGVLCGSTEGSAAVELAVMDEPELEAATGLAACKVESGAPTGWLAV